MAQEGEGAQGAFHRHRGELSLLLGYNTNGFAVKFVEETDKAAKAFQQLQDGWAAVYYSADELPQDVQEVCRRRIFVASTG